MPKYEVTIIPHISRHFWEDKEASLGYNRYEKSLAEERYEKHEATVHIADSELEVIHKAVRKRLGKKTVYEPNPSDPSGVNGEICLSPSIYFEVHASVIPVAGLPTEMDFKDADWCPKTKFVRRWRRQLQKSIKSGASRRK